MIQYYIMNGEYLERVIESAIKTRLMTSGAVLIEGAKWCGKTWTGKKMSKSAIFMEDPDNLEKNRYDARNKPSALLEGETPRLIDEWQQEPILWDAVRFAVDGRGKPGQFILTGSSCPDEKSIMHSGTGRISRLLMRPMSLYESKESTGEVSLRSLFTDGAQISGESNITLDRLAFLISRGGWPSSLNYEGEYALRVPKDYLSSLINIDVTRVDNVRKNPERVRRLMESLSRNICSMATSSSIAQDMGEDSALSKRSMEVYINALRRLYVVEDVPAWSPNIRSKAAIRKTPKRNLVDPSLAVAAMKTSPVELAKDLRTMGLLFESLCIRDLRVYAESIGGRVCYYRDSNELEVDAIIDLDDGRWAAVEVKLGDKAAEQGAKNLLRLKTRVEGEGILEPSFLAVVTGSGFAHRREDGVYVIPIGCLRN